MAPISTRDGIASNGLDSHISFIGASIAGGIVIGILVASALFSLFGKLDADLRWRLEHATRAFSLKEEKVIRMVMEKDTLQNIVFEQHLKIAAAVFVRTKLQESRMENDRLKTQVIEKEIIINRQVEQVAAAVVATAQSQESTIENDRMKTQLIEKEIVTTRQSEQIAALVAASDELKKARSKLKTELENISADLELSKGRVRYLTQRAAHKKNRREGSQRRTQATRVL